MKQKLSWAGVIVASFALGAGALAGIDSLRGDDGGGAGLTTVIERVSPSSDGSNISTTPDDVSDLYDAVRPSVVRITGQGGSASGLGSGIVLDTQGHILTNNHVIDGM